MGEKITKSDAQWRAELSDEIYRITRQHGTERAFTGTYHDNKDAGIYRCVCCDTPLFNALEKYDSGSGWPSFWQPLAGASIDEVVDSSHSMNRTEVRCGQCDAHLGHVFPDGPQPTGLRYCINSASLSFVADDG